MNDTTRTAAVAAALIFLAWPLERSLAQTPHTHQHRFDDAAKWSQIFDDPRRDAWQKPHEVIQALAPRPDAVIADIGAGTGYFALRFSHMVPQGRVYAVDTEAAMVKHLAERAKQAGASNLTALQAAPDDPRLPEKADLIVFVDDFPALQGPNGNKIQKNKLREMAAATLGNVGSR